MILIIGRYEKAKIEIVKQLELNPDSLPNELESWMRKELPIALHLKIDSIRRIKYHFKKANPNVYDTHQYLKTDFSTTDGLPFLRSQIFTKDSKDGLEFDFKVLFWSSDFQLNRLRLSDHWYIDGTFDAVPPEYTQTVNILIRDSVSS